MPMSERFRDSPVFKISFYRRSIINNNFDYDLRISRIEPRSKNFSNTTVGNFPKKFAKFRIHRIFRKDIFRTREKIGEFGISPEFLCFARNRFNPYFTGSVPQGFSHKSDRFKRKICFARFFAGILITRFNKRGFLEEYASPRIRNNSYRKKGTAGLRVRHVRIGDVRAGKEYERLCVQKSRSCAEFYCRVLNTYWNKNIISKSVRR